MISEPTVFSFECKTTVLADELMSFMFCQKQKNMVFCGNLREVLAKLHSDNFALLAFYLNVIETRSQGN